VILFIHNDETTVTVMSDCHRRYSYHHTIYGLRLSSDCGQYSANAIGLRTHDSLSLAIL